MLAFSIDYYGVLFRATQSVGLFCTYYITALIGFNLCNVRKRLNLG